MSQAKKESQAIPEGSGRVVSMHDLVDQHAPRPEEAKSADSNGQHDAEAVQFEVDLSRLSDDEKSQMVENLAKSMKNDESTNTFAVNYSILRDPFQASNYEESYGKYILAFPFMFLVACYVAVKVFFYRILRLNGSDKLRLLLGPKNGTIFFDGLDHAGYAVRNGVTTSKALDVIYNIDLAYANPKKFSQKVVRFWLDQPDGQGVRNRLRKVYFYYQSEISRLVNSGITEIRIATLACGSAQAAIEALAWANGKYPNVKFQMTLVDIDATSLKRAELFAKARGVRALVEIQERNIVEFLRENLTGGYHIVEMVGFLDYRKDDRVIFFSNEIKKALTTDGVYITANISPSKWSFIVRWLINWPLLIRRTDKEFHQLLLKSSYKEELIEIEYIPTNTHVVAMCRNDG